MSPGIGLGLMPGLNKVVADVEWGGEAGSGQDGVVERAQGRWLIEVRGML